MKYIPLFMMILLFGAQWISAAEMRTWKLTDGRTFQAKIAGGVPGINSVKLENAAGRKVEIPLDQLSKADRNYIELSRPPQLNIDILRSFKQKIYSGLLSRWPADVRPPEIHAYFGVRVKKVGGEAYNHELKAELFAIGEQLFADRYILLDRESWKFRLTKEDKERFEVMSKRYAVLHDFQLKDYYSQNGYTRRGEKYYGYIILVTDERGKVVAHEESNKWLYDHLDNLKKLHKGNYLDKTCKRRYPVRPESMYLIDF